MTPATSPTSSRPLSTTSSDPEERLAYIALALIDGLGARRLAGVLSRFGSARAILAAPREELLDIEGMTPAAVTAIAGAPLDEAKRLQRRAEQKGHRILVPCDDDYPARLRSIPDPPIILFAIGSLELLDRPAV